jgi:ATP-dependent helicase/nuclease subunit A
MTSTAAGQTTLHSIVQRQRLAPQQLQAVLAQGGKLLVVAGAGTGKTKTLTARILHLLAQEETWSVHAPLGPTDGQPADVDGGQHAPASDATPLRRIAAVTFTTKAAREMRTRLRSQMAAFLREEAVQADERGRWERLLIDLEAAPIGTIHSLCTTILRAHPAEAALDPQFGVLEEGSAAGVIEDAVDTALAWAVNDPMGAPLFALFETGALRSLCRSLIQRRLDVAPALSAAAEARLREDVAAFRRRLRGFVIDAGVIDDMAAVALAAERARGDARLAEDKLVPFLWAAEEAWQAVQDAIAAEEWGRAAAALERLQQAVRCKLGVAKSWLPLTPKEHFADLRDLFAERLPELGACDPALDEQLLALLPAVRELFARATAGYAAAKQELRVLDFDDLELRAVALLEGNAEVRTLWQARFLALLVDEFQDTNERQRRLIELLTRDPAVLTFVGDPKQSIYRFRGANVQIMQRELANLVTGGVTLATSYRSHGALVALLNGLLAPVLGELDEPPRTRFGPLEPSGLVLPRVDGPYVELLLAQGAKSAGALVCAAQRLAQRLLALRAAGFAWSEMAILCRRVSSFDAYEDALEAAGVPYVTVAGRGFYNRPEVRDLINALRALNDPGDNLALLGLLRSPAVGLPDTQLFQLGIHALVLQPANLRMMAPGQLWSALRGSPDAEAQAAVALVETLHALAGRSTVATLIKSLFDMTGYPAALGQAGQARAARNLAKLLEDALRSGETSVGAFLAAVEVQQRGGAREGEARADAEGVVQIMTVHAAKGLQWPVVVICDAGAEGGRGRGDLLVDGERLFLDLRSPGAGNTRRRGLLHSEAEAHNADAEAAESDRLLYVAATRAEQMLIFSGTWQGSRSVDLRGWLKRLTESLNLEAHLLPLIGVAPVEQGCAEAPLLDAWVAPGEPRTAPAEVAARLTVDSAVRLVSWPVGKEEEGVTAAAHTNNGDAPVDPDQNGFQRLPPLVESVRRPLPPVPPASATPLVAPLHTAGVVEAPRRAWRIVPRGAVLYAPGWVVGQIVHDALAAWRFPTGPNDTSFANWVRSRARSYGLTENDRIEDGVRRTIRQLGALAAHPLRAEIEGARERYHDLPYDRPPLTTAPPLPGVVRDPLATWDSGRIDLLYRRAADGRWVVVDFKTERIVTPEQRARWLGYEEFTAHAKRQRIAVRSLVGEDPETLIVFLDDQRSLSVQLLQPPDTAAQDLPPGLP